MPAVSYAFRNWLEETCTLRILDGCFDLLVKIGPDLLVSIVIRVAVTRFFSTRKKLLFPHGTRFMQRSTSWGRYPVKL